MVTRERPTLEAVARRAGVSRATVSRVVNGSTTVAVAIRDAVKQAVDELGYVPNQAARSLVTQRTESIALILPETANRVFSDDLFFPAVIRGVSMELDAADKQLVLMMAGSAASHDRVERYAMAGHVDGVMFASHARRRPAAGHAGPARHPGRVQRPADDPGRAPRCPTWTWTTSAASRQPSGTCSPAAAAGSPRSPARRTWSPASTGWPATAGAGGGGPAANRCSVGDFTRESGIRAMRRLLDDDPPLDAVFVASDMMAHGALQALKEAGRRVPADVAVIGFDDFEISRLSDPPLTTVRQPIVDMGSTMARQMLGLVNDKPTASADAVVLPTELVVRASA